MTQLVHGSDMHGGRFFGSPWSGIGSFVEERFDQFVEFFTNSGPTGYVLGALAALIVLFLIVFYFVTSAKLGQELGKKKGFTVGWLWGLLMGPVGIALLLVRPGKQNLIEKGGSE